MSGFDTAAAAIGLLAGCIQLYEVFKTGKSIGEEGALLNTKLVVERVRLENWAERAGLPDDPNPRLRWDVIRLVLVQQQSLLQSAGDLTERYHLKKEQGIGEVHGEDANSENDAVALILRTSREVHNERDVWDKGIRIRNNVVQKAKWATSDKTKLEGYIAKIIGLNDQLISLLDNEAQLIFQYVLNVALRTSVSNSGDASQLHTIRQALPNLVPSIEAAAGVKDLRLRLGFEQQDNESAVETNEPIVAKDFKHFNEDKLVKGMEEAMQGMCITTYNQSVYLVEWRTIETNWAIIQPSLRNLAMLLTKTSDPTFHTLPCAGYASIETEGRFAFVYDITRFATGTDPTSLQSCSLLDLLSENHFVPVAVRVRIANDMAEAILQLHTANWLHKGICSQNVRFIAKVRAKPRDVVIAGEHFLVGYGYARPDTASGVLMTELPVSASDRDLYRHPSARGEDRQSFQKRFDMYGLACILVELAFWEPLDKITSRFKSPAPGSALPSLGELMSDDDFRNQLSYHVMPAYTKAIELCLGVTESSANDHRTLTSMEAGVLKELTICKGLYA